LASGTGTGSAGVAFTTSPRNVTFMLNDGTTGVHATVVANGGSSIRTTPDAQMPGIPGRGDGYTFVGWNTRPDGTWEWFTDSTIVLDNITVYAQWTQHWYSVQFVDRDGTPISTMRVPHGGDAIAPPNPSIAGWIYIGWDRPYKNVTEDITVRAVYRAVVTPPPSPPPVEPTPTPDPLPPAPPEPPPPAPPPAPPPVTQILIVRPPAPPPAEPPPAEPPQDEQPPNEEPPEEPPVMATIIDNPVPATRVPRVPETILEDPIVPLANPGFIFFAPWGADYWALLNLILAILGAILTPIALIKVLQKRKQIEREVEIELNSLSQNEVYIIDEERLYHKRRLEWFAATAVLGGIGILIFVLTQDMRKTMALMDWWTIFHVIVFVLEIIAFRLIYKKEKDEDNRSNKHVKIHQT